MTTPALTWHMLQNLLAKVLIAMDANTKENVAQFNFVTLSPALTVLSHREGGT